jgi:ABC-type sugar transport system permease subunit
MLPYMLVLMSPSLIMLSNMYKSFFEMGKYAPASAHAVFINALQVIKSNR